MHYNDILSNYLDTGIIGRMIANGYALYPAKSAGYAGRRGIGYHVDMSIRTHVLNGLFPVSRLLTFLDARGIYTMSEEDFRRLLVYFTTHDFHKDPEAVAAKGSRGEFDVPLVEVEQEMAALGIGDFVATTPAEHRVTMVHLPSPKVGDYADARTGTSRLEPWVHIADALSSMQTARDYRTLANYLRRALARQYARQPWAFYWHELDDYRGLSTLLLHQATSALLEEQCGLYPLLYFPNGVLYIGPLSDDFGDTAVLRKRIGVLFFQLLQDGLAEKAPTIAQRAIRRPQGTVKFRTDAFVFAGVEQLVQALRNETHRATAKRFLTARFGDRMRRKDRTISDEAITKHVGGFCSTYAIPASAEEDDDFSTKWAAVSGFVMGMESIATALLGAQADEWLFQHFHTPPSVADAIIANRKDLTSGGLADHAVIIAYHYLATERFGPDGRTASTVDIQIIFDDLQAQAVAALRPHDTVARRLAYVNAEYGLEMDIVRYLDEHLVLSFGQERAVSSPLPLLVRKRTYSHGRVCSFCNREIPIDMKQKQRKIGDLAGIVTTTFSNRVVPRSGRQAPMQVWCPMCYLEFMLREHHGLGYRLETSGRLDKQASLQLYLFLLPDYSFTPEFWQYARRQLLKPFESVTSLKLRRGFGDEVDAPTVPNTWLLRNEVDEVWLEEVQRLFEQAAQQVAAIAKSGRLRRDLLGRLKIASVRSPNFQLLIYENAVPTHYRDLAPTHSEMWAKAAYTAMLLHLLLGVRVYITDRPYLPLSRPDEMKHIIELDGAHPLLRHVLPHKGTASAPHGTAIALTDLKEAIDLLSAVWEANAALSGGKGNLDKQVASVLERVNVEPLAGAGFYKERERAGYVVYPALLRACELLLELRGGDKLNLAEKLTDASLELFIPLSRKDGKRHRYETMFRTAIEMVKTSPRRISDDELEARVAGRLLKRLDRIQGGVVPLYGETLAKAATDFAQLVVRDLFRRRCGGRTARLTHEMNAMADAIYYLTDRQIGDRWKQYRAAKAARKEKKNATQ